MKNEKIKIWLILDNIRSIHNVGSIFRTADGFLVEKIFLIGQTPAPIDRFGRNRPDFLKVSLGAEKNIDYKYYQEIDDAFKECFDNNFVLCAIEQSSNSKPLTDLKGLGKIAIILGNEVSGVSKEVLDKCDYIFELPMLGKKESFNVSVMTGIVLYQARFMN